MKTYDLIFTNKSDVKALEKGTIESLHQISLCEKEPEIISIKAIADNGAELELRYKSSEKNTLVKIGKKFDKKTAETTYIYGTIEEWILKNYKKA